MSADPAHSPPEDASRERRRKVRYVCRIITLCQTGAARVDDFWRRARIDDISATGVSLVLHCSLPVGTELLIEPLFASEEMPVLPTARVVHSISRKGQGYLLGCAFTRQLDETQLQALLQTATS